MKYKRQRNERKKKSHIQRYNNMTAKEWAKFKKTASVEEVLEVRNRALKMLKK